MAKVFLAGRAVRDAEEKVTKKGETVYIFDLAENYKGNTTYYKVFLKSWFGNIARYITKGRSLAISGSFTMEAYVGKKDGKAKASMTIFADDVVLMSSYGDEQESSNYMENDDGISSKADASGFVPVTEEELPF